MRTIGPYQVIRQIGSGGMGVVLHARPEAGPEVAVKILKDSVSSLVAKARFRAEAATLVRLSHPNVVRLLATGEEGGKLWLALEYVAGESLEARLTAMARLTIPEAISTSLQIANGLAYLHGCGVVHRDLKPGNIMLRGKDALITDFGIALDTGTSLSRLTNSGVFLGTPGYWAPELAQGELSLAGPQSDVYGLGAVLYACLIGEPPVVASSLPGYMMTASFKRVAPPHTLRPEVPRWLSDLCMRCLAVLPQRRPASADEVARLLLAAQSDWIPSRRPQRRRAALVLGLGLGSVSLAIAAITLAGVPSWVADRSEVQPDRTPLPTDDSGSQNRVLVEEVDTDAKPTHVDDATLEARVARAEALIGQGGSVEDALRALEQGEEIEGGTGPSSGFLALLGRLHSMQGSYQLALSELDRAILLDPGNVLAHSERGFVLLRLKRPSEALWSLESALRLDPSSARAHAFKGAVLMELGQQQEALESLNRAVDLNPNDAEALTDRAMARFWTDQQREPAVYPTPTLEDLNRAIYLDDHYAAAFYYRGWILKGVGRFREALLDLRRAIELQEDYSPAWTAIGASLGEMGRSEEAYAALDRAHRLDKTDPQPLIARGILHGKNARYAEALEDFNAALALGVDPQQRASVERMRTKAKAGTEAE